MLGMLWYMDRDDPDTAATKAIKRFTEKHGYPPRTLVGRMEDLNGMHVRADIQVQARGGIQPRHYMLYEIIRKKQPKILKVERTPVL